MTDTIESTALHADSLGVSFTANDLAASVAWYRDVLGFTVDQEHVRDGVLRAVSLRAGNVRMILNQDDWARGTDRAKGEGFAIMLTTSQNVDDIARRIEQAGGTLDTPPTDMPWGARVFRVRDPNGFRINVSSR